MTYVADPRNPTQPSESVDLVTAAAEFRALKAYVRDDLLGEVVAEKTAAGLSAVSAAASASSAQAALNGIDEKFEAYEAGLAPDALAIALRTEAARDAAREAETAAEAAQASAEAAEAQAEAARDSSFANAKGAATIADARALVADTETFIVYATNALTFDAYRRTSSSTEVFLGSYRTNLALAPYRVRVGASGHPQIVDANGAELLGFDSDGRAILRLQNGIVDAALSGLGFRTGAESFPSIKDLNGVELLGFDSTGRARFAVSQDVIHQIEKVIDFSGAYDPVSSGLFPSRDIWQIGDSMSTPTYITGIGSALPGVSIANVAKGGFDAFGMSVVVGAEPLTVTLSGNEIPASGGVAVTSRNINILSSGGTNTGTANVTINGVAGVLSTDSGGNWTFTRSASGSVVSVSPGSVAVLAPTSGTAFIPGTELYLNRRLVLRLGRNGVRGTRAQRVAQTLAPMRKIIDRLSPRHKEIVIITPYNGRAQDHSTGANHEGNDTAAYAAIMTLIEEMRREFGRLLLDTRSWAVKNAIYDAGLVPTADDLADMAKDCIPRQLFSAGDNTHVNTTMQALEGAFVANHLRALGWR
jgi:hypothetical protein